MTKIVFTFRDEAGDSLAERSEDMIRSGPPLKLTGVVRSIQFLRGVFSRATLCLPAFYYFLGSASARESAKTSPDYALKVAQSYSEFSDLNTLSLSCRKVFDHDVKQDLTGANFAKTTDAVLVEHAEYWSKSHSHDFDEGLAALKFLRTLFSTCSKTDSDLLRASSQLQRRVGLLKQHANRAAAHISLENYSLEIADLAHFTAALAVIGEVIRSFDYPGLRQGYFNDLDKASHHAARRIFPQIAEFQLFGGMQVDQQARGYLRIGEDVGIAHILDGLQHALGGKP